MTMTQYEKLYPKLKYFFSAYFHQDWKVVYDWQGEKPSFQAVVHDFKNSNPKETVVKVIQELEQLLKQDLTEDDLSEILSNQLGSEIYVSGLGLTYREWLKVILTVLKERQ
jgi:HD superfamily phosphohydrolase YqeK